MKTLISATALLLASYSAGNAQAPSTAQMGITHTTNPEVVSVLDASKTWAQIGSVDKSTHLFTPVGTSGAGGDINVANWGGQPVGPATGLGVSPTSGLLANVNAYILNWPALQAVSVATLPLPIGAALASLQPPINSDGGAQAHITNFPVTAPINGDGGSQVHVMNFPATQAISAASLPLAAGAAQSGLQAPINADAGSQVHVMNFPATQAISAASLPLPALAATAALQSGVQSAAGSPAALLVSVQGNVGGILLPVNCVTGCGGSGGGSAQAFQPTPSYSQLAASDTINHSVATPVGPDEGISNLDTAIAYCNFGAASTTNTFPIQGLQSIGIHFGGTASTIQCQSPSSTLKITISGGTGQFTSVGGGGGAGGSGGGPSSNVTVVNTSAGPIPTYPVNTSATQVTPSGPFPVTPIGQVFSTKTVPISIASSNASASVVIQPGAPGLLTYVSLINVEALAGKNFSLVEGTGTACGTSQTVLTGNMPTSGSWDGANGGSSPAIQTQIANDDLCAVVSTSTAYGGWMQLVQK